MTKVGCFCADDDILRLLISPRKAPGPEDPHTAGSAPPQVYHAACLVHGTLTTCKHNFFLAALQAAADGNNPTSKQRQPPQDSNPVTKAGQRPLPKPSSAWEQFMDAEAETSQAAPEADSPTGLLTAPHSSQKSLTQPHIPGVSCRRGLQSGSLAASAPGSKVHQQAHCGMTKCIGASRSSRLPQAGPIDTTGSQQSHAGDQLSDGQYKANATPAATACKPLVPIFSKHKQHVFKPPAMVPGHEENSQSKAPSWQNSSSVQAAHGVDSKPVFVFDELHAVARHVAIPVSFASLHSYQQSWSGAVTEEVNIRYTPELLTVCWQHTVDCMHGVVSPDRLCRTWLKLGTKTAQLFCNMFCGKA